MGKFLQRVVFRLVVFLSFLSFLAKPHPVMAAPPLCSNSLPTFSFQGNWPSNPVTGGSYVPRTVTFSGLRPNEDYKIIAFIEQNLLYEPLCEVSSIRSTTAADGRGTITWNVTNNSCFTKSDAYKFSDHTAYIKIEPVTDPSAACTAHQFTLLGVNNTQSINCNSSSFSFLDSEGRAGCFEAGESINWSVSDIKYPDGTVVTNFPIDVIFENTTSSSAPTRMQIVDGRLNGTITASSTATGQNLTISLKLPGFNTYYCSGARSLRAPGTCTPADRGGPPQDTGTNAAVPFSLCDQVSPEDKAACITCFGTGSTSGQGDTAKPTGFWTAFGCIQTDTAGMITNFLRIGLAMAGGFVLLSILYGAFLLTTSSGDPKRVQEGQEMVSSAVMGLLFIIFSVIILRFIGVSILRIPGFGGP